MIQTPLDCDELLHIAITASQNNQHDVAIANLKRALEIDPNNAKVCYFLGAEHAQIGLYDRALEEFKKAVKLDPSLTTAHFQLGLLLLTSGRVEEATEAWSVLDKLGPEHPFYLFKTGMIQLANDEFDACEENLRKGIALNNFNLALNNDMQKILDEITVRKNDGRIQKAQTPQPEKSDSTHIFLSAYTSTSKDD